MKKLEYVVRFVTPAFIGNAEQNGQWRTPPFKALLRQWWRVAYFSRKREQFDLTAMRHDEGVLFGHAWLKGDTYERDGRRVTTAARKSSIRLRLVAPDGSTGDEWRLGTQRGVAPMRDDPGTSYAWFGLVEKNGTRPHRTAVRADKAVESTRVLQLAFPEEQADCLCEVVRLITTFGTIGARSRGGWGSLQIDGVSELGAAEILQYGQPIAQCLQRDWAAALASDDDTGKTWVWQMNMGACAWHDAMSELAGVRRDVRAALKVDSNLSFALGFASSGRMPSPLRWKIINDAGTLAIRVCAMPHKLPSESGEAMSNQQLKRAWNIVRDYLDMKMNRL